VRAIILAGGFGTRIAEESGTKPKPMVLLDDKPIIWHLMNSLFVQGINEFIVAAGYLGEILDSWARSLESEWNIQVIDTGLNTQTAGRIKKCLDLFDDKNYLLTYGDGLGNVNVKNLLTHHRDMGCAATVTCVRPPARFGVLEKSNGMVTHFGEKRQSDVGWINGGFFIIESQIKNYIKSESESFEIDIMPSLASGGQLAAFEHLGFWQPMDTLRERNELAILATQPRPPWIIDQVVS
jgi:glucose-1-phosphate cytidylyltransferase